MTLPLLKTKLHIPPIRSEVVPRRRLIERLDAGLSCRLALLSAPAGFGKTTLLSEWVTRLHHPPAWLSLDEEDNDAARFWTYAIAALQTAHPGFGQGVLQLLQAPQPPATHVILTALINQVSALSAEVVLILDDYHAISDRSIHEGATFLLEHMPANMHVVISTRADPPLPTHRLRVRGQLTELRSRDLRFTADEAGAFLNAMMGLDLAREDVEALEARTEGWIAGLQLAALSLQDRADAHEFIAAFGGGHHYVLEYLTEEVVRRQPEQTQRFLMQTSILDRLCGPLCDAVTGDGEGEVTLARLLQRNLFIVPLDDEHYWARYHHLFADLLGNLLRTSWPPEQIRDLHRRACDWYDRNESPPDAVRHALAAQDYERTAQLIERNSLAMVTRGELRTLLRWIRALPEDVALSRPWLCIHQAWPLVFAGKPDEAGRLLRQVDKLVPQDGLTPEHAEMLGHVAAMRALMASMAGDLSRAVEMARRADELLPADNLIPRNVIPFIFASAYYAEGDLAGASRAILEELEIGQAADNLWTVVRSRCDLADLRMIQGQLRTAEDLCREALQQAEERGARHFGTVGYVLVKLGEILFERNELAVARNHVVEGVSLMQGWQQPYEMVHGYTALAAILQSQDDPAAAREALENAVRIQAQRPNYARVNSLVRVCQIRLALAQDGPVEAARQAHELRLGEIGGILVREHEQITLARVRIAEQKWQEALDLLAQLASEAQAGERVGRLVEILALQAVARQARGDTAGALIALEGALGIGEAEGYVRVFAEHGEPMAGLLQRAATRGIAPQYVQNLLAALGVEQEEQAVEPVLPDIAALVEPLTPRELEVLNLIGEGDSNRQIAEALVISLNSVKKHTSNIYGKLGVHSRTQAVVRAQELGLL